MKRIILIAIVAIILLFASGCGTTTITEHEGNYLYTQNENINILDIDTRNIVGTLIMTGTKVLENKNFIIKEKISTDKSGNDVYEEVKYEQLVQVFYTYDSKSGGKSISASNFSVYDSSGTYCSINPNIEYSAEKKYGEQSIVVALKNTSDYINVSFKYNVFQTTNTAKIKLNVGNESSNTNSQIENANSGDETSSSIDNTKNDMNPLILYAIIGILSLIILTLIIVIIIQSKRTK